jgi:hypothetical protein
VNGGAGGVSGGVGGAVKSAGVGRATGVKPGDPSGESAGLGIGGSDAGGVTLSVSPGANVRTGDPPWLHAAMTASSPATTKNRRITAQDIGQ